MGDETQVDEGGLRTSGVDAIMRLPDRNVHLIAGPNVDQYAAEMRAQLAGAVDRAGAVGPDGAVAAAPSR
jgi:phosphotransferase system IIB component